jgi:hypothetical protein
MKEIVIMASANGNYPLIAETVKALFPKCKLNLNSKQGGVIWAKS